MDGVVLVLSLVFDHSTSITKFQCTFSYNDNGYIYIYIYIVCYLHTMCIT